MNARTWAAEIGSRLRVGSSKKRISGSASMPRAIASFCFWPEEKSLKRASALPASPTCSSSRSIRFVAAAPVMPCRFAKNMRFWRPVRRQ